MDAAHEIASDVLLEMIAVDYDGLGRLRRRGGSGAFGLRRFLVGTEVAKDEDEALGIRRPFEALEVQLRVRELRGFAAFAIEEPDLVALGRPRTAGSEREIFAVGRPARRAFRFLAFGELAFAGTISGGHPDVRIALVGFDVGGADIVGDPFAVGRALRVADVAHAGEIVDGQVALLLRLSLAGGQQKAEAESEDDSDAEQMLPCSGARR